MSNPKRSRRIKLPLKARITCPHCWTAFPPGDIKWIASHPDLQGDEKLGRDAQTRFLPSRFTISGMAMDIRGEQCQQLACPNCHLGIPRALLEMAPLFLSILGAPASGKSNYLTAMTWKMRTTLALAFGINFVDADPTANGVLNRYEEILFKNPKPNSLVKLWKTEPDGGELLNSVLSKGRSVFHPKPFVFSLVPKRDHFPGRSLAGLGRALCLYDNAGEHFMPGGDANGQLVTKHLTLSRAMLYLFDPTQHHQFRAACEGRSDDPQLSEYGVMNPQEGVLAEAAHRIKVQTGLRQDEQCPQPLIVVLTKYDAWSALTNDIPLDPSWIIKTRADGRSGLDLERLKAMSDRARDVLHRYSPEVVSAAEGNFSDVTYLPVSALGCSPEVHPETGELVVRPKNLQPTFAEVPLLYALHRAVPGLVPAVKSSGEKITTTKKPSTEPKTRVLSPADRPDPETKTTPGEDSVEEPTQGPHEVVLQEMESDDPKFKEYKP